MNKEVSFFLLTLLTLSPCVYAYAGYGGVTLSAWTDDPPTIDGIMGQGEWGAADFSGFATDHDPPLNGTIYVMNDAENLYIYVIFNKFDVFGSIRIMFDNDNDGTEWEPDDDGLYYGWHPYGGFKDVHYSAWTGDASQDGAGEMNEFGDYMHVEFSHPLNSGDPEDFSLVIGDTVGFQIMIRDSDMVEGFWPPQAQTTNEITIAGPPEYPVGGELMPINSLTMYLTLTLTVIGISLILSYTISGKNKQLLLPR